MAAREPELPAAALDADSPVAWTCSGRSRGAGGGGAGCISAGCLVEDFFQDIDGSPSTPGMYDAAAVAQGEGDVSDAEFSSPPSPRAGNRAARPESAAARAASGGEEAGGAERQAASTPAKSSTSTPGRRTPSNEGPLTPGLVTRARGPNAATPDGGERPLPTTPASTPAGRGFKLSSRSASELGLSPEQDSAVRRHRSTGSVGARRPSLGSSQGEIERRLAGKSVEVRGHAGCRPEINGVYATVRETWSGRTAFRNRTSQVYMVWMWHPPRWKIVPHMGGPDTLAYVDCCGEEGALPFEAPGPWFVVGRGDESSADMADDAVTCRFVGQTVVVSGRSGHNQRLNGIYEELPEAYGGFPVYADRQKHLFIYRRLDSSQWVIGNRLGPSLRTGRGTVFAEVDDDAPQPYLVRKPWTVHAWAGRPVQQDTNISVFLRAETFKDGPPPVVLTIRSKMHSLTEGTYTLRSGQLVNDRAVYVRSHEEEPHCVEKFLFWDGERWCIAGSTDARKKQCDVCSQRREAEANCQPDHAVWPGIEVLPGDAGVIGASLLASLRGKISSLSKHFS